MARVYRHATGRRIANVLVRALLRVGLGPPRTYVLTVLGRKSGRPYSTPVTLVVAGDRRWIVAPYGNVGWVCNARAAGEVTLGRGRHSETVHLAEVGAAEAGAVLKRYAVQVPITRPFFDARHDDPVATFVAEADRHPVFRIQPA